MHHVDFDFDLNLKEISKIEGAASLEIKVRQGKIDDLKFSISEWKRFYTQAIRDKPIVAIPQLVSRICGTCSNAHLLCCIEAIEKGLGIQPSKQTIILRKLLYYGLIIRDHALHLYVFCLPDIFNKNSILDFDDTDPEQHKLLHDAFAVKEVGNQLSILVGGRSVHAPQPTIGGFIKLPTLEELKSFQTQLNQIRERIIKIIDIFARTSFNCRLDKPVTFAGLTSDDFSFIEGKMKTSDGQIIEEKDVGQHLDATIIPYSHARGFSFDGKLMMVGALARINLNKEALHPKTKLAAYQYLQRFPSENIYDNNLAQAIEILHAIDRADEIITNLTTIVEETPTKIVPADTTGIGVIEAPRGTLYYKLEITKSGTIKKGEIIVPTGQNQIIMEKAIYQAISQMLPLKKSKEEIVSAVEQVIRAFDPCMSCASHFLTVKWK